MARILMGDTGGLINHSLNDDDGKKKKKLKKKIGVVTYGTLNRFGGFFE